MSQKLYGNPTNSLLILKIPDLIKLNSVFCTLIITGEFHTIYLGPEEGEDKQIPLIVYPHGGPPMSFVNQFSIDYAFFNALGKI